MEYFVMPENKYMLKKKRKEKESDNDMSKGHWSQVKALMANTQTAAAGNRILPQSPKKGISWTHS